jgi:hypothetical protein
MERSAVNVRYFVKGKRTVAFPASLGSYASERMGSFQLGHQLLRKAAQSSSVKQRSTR